VTASRYSIGVDFGTESVRALLVDCSDGTEVASAVYAYANGVIDEHLPAPEDDVSLDVDWALQDPGDYIRASARRSRRCWRRAASIPRRSSVSAST
jgi:L-ribulokinase